MIKIDRLASRGRALACCLDVAVLRKQRVILLTALDRAQHFARRFRYVLQIDVEQFFPAIDHKPGLRV